jgi:hypothetical protein
MPSFSIKNLISSGFVPKQGLPSKDVTGLFWELLTLVTEPYPKTI